MAENRKLGKYEILEELGRGGFGIVYKAKDCVLDRYVALKVLHSQLSVNPEFITRFAREAKLAARLDHPNIVPVHDFDQREGYTFIAMGYMAGGSLKDYLTKHGAFNPSRAKTMVEQIASGLAYAHEQNIIHRDLKPGNILIDANGMARISDFGFAKALHADSLSMSIGGGMLGTPAYMAPEVWGGETVTPASDIYSLGCIAHEMLTGEQLFKGETPIQVMHAHFVKGPVPIEGIAPAWQNFLDRCLMREAKDRYPTASAVLEDLKRGMFDAPEKRQSETVLTSVDDKAPEEMIKPELIADSIEVFEFTDQFDKEQEAPTQDVLDEHELYYYEIERESTEEITQDEQDWYSKMDSQPIPETDKAEQWIKDPQIFSSPKQVQKASFFYNPINADNSTPEQNFEKNEEITQGQRKILVIFLILIALLILLPYLLSTF